MGCFLACFGTKKDRKRRKSVNRILPRDQRNGSYKPLIPTESLKQVITEKPINQVPESRDELEEQLSFSTRKKVTFDLNVKTYVDVSTQETTNQLDDEEKETEKKEEKDAKQSQLALLPRDNSITSGMGSYPSNHRYQNCGNSDDEYEEIESDDDLDDGDYDKDDSEEDDDPPIGEEVSSESFFSLPTESRTRGSVNPLVENEVNSPAPLTQELKTLRSNQNARDRSQYVHSVLNPVENLSQWKAVKEKTPSPLKPHKENVNFDQELQIPFSSEPSFKLSPLKNQKKENINLEQNPQMPIGQEFSFKTPPFSLSPNNDHSKPPKQEISVETSLSNWLGSSETTPSTKTSNISNGFELAEGSKSQKSNSPRSYDDRPILGALTVEELKQLSVTSSPRRSPSRSPDEIPIVGTVGSYWNHTAQDMDSNSGSSCKGIPNTTSKYREDKSVNWHSTPFQTRLERALNIGAAEAYSNYQRKV